eukprot:11189949-Lingulodinium_polyedra.AAC.1
MDQDAGPRDGDDRGGGRPVEEGVSRPGDTAVQPSGRSGDGGSRTPAAARSASRGARRPQRAGTGAGSSRDGV